MAALAALARRLDCFSFRSRIFGFLGVFAVFAIFRIPGILAIFAIFRILGVLGFVFVFAGLSCAAMVPVMAMRAVLAIRVVLLAIASTAQHTPIRQACLNKHKPLAFVSSSLVRLQIRKLISMLNLPNQ